MAKTIVLEEYAKQRSKRIGLVKKYGVTSIFLLPYLTAFIVFFLVPLFYGIYISLTNFQYGKPGLENFNDFMWFKMIFDKSFMPGIYNSFWLAFVREYCSRLITLGSSVCFRVAQQIHQHLRIQTH